MKILKEQSAQTTTRVVGIAHRLWTTILSQESAQFNKVKDIYLFIYIYFASLFLFLNFYRGDAFR